MRRALLVLLLAGCSPYSVVKQAAPNPFVGQSRFALLPFDWSGLSVEGQTEANWDKGNDDDMRREWVQDKQNAAHVFIQVLTDSVSSRVQLYPSDALAPSGYSLKPMARELDVGGLRPTRFTVRLQLLDSTGFVVDEASSTHKSKSGEFFPTRIVEAATLCGDGLGQYILSRVL